MSFDRTQPNFLKLEKLIIGGEQKVVPFIGAGLSVYGNKEERLPVWSQLLYKLIERSEYSGLVSKEDAVKFERIINNGDYIKATDEILNTIGEVNFRIFIEEIFDISNKPIPPVLTTMVCISWSLIVTTNLDQFVEKAWNSRYKKNIEVLTNVDTTKLSQVIAGSNTDSNKYIAKIHGTLEKYESWILTGKHYDLLLARNTAYVEAIKNLFLKTIFFVGYGLNDGDFDVLLSQIKTIFPAGIGNYFALLDKSRKGSSSLNYLIKEYGIQPIWYDFQSENRDNPDGGHGDVLECLQLLVEAWVKKNNSINTKLKYFPELEHDFVGRCKEIEILKRELTKENPTSIQILGFGGEGKTSLVQFFIKEQLTLLASCNYHAVFGCSFYRADIGRFINHTYSFLHPNPSAFDIPTKVNEIIKIVRSKKILLILDGLEVIQDEDGKIENKYIKNIISSANNGYSSVIITSRVPCHNFGIKEINLGPLDDNDVISILNKWGFNTNSYEIRRIIRNKIGHHALTVRILAGFIKSENSNINDIVNNIEIVDIPDEANTLKANKAIRILNYYCKFLSHEALSFMKCFTIFKRPTPLSVITSCFNKQISNCSVNIPLINIDLRILISDLIERRLIIVESDTYLTTHPTIRDFFKNETTLNELKPLHSIVADYYYDEIGNRNPNSFEQSLISFDLCYHSANAERWNLFHHTFSKIINRDHKNYLGTTLGAWEEFLDLTLLTYVNKDLKTIPQIDPPYYLSATARALKRLGYSKLSQQQYIKCIRICGNSNHSETARYINNFLTLLISMGEFEIANKLMLLNTATIDWIKEEWKKKWQITHAYFAIGQLISLQGDTKFGMKLCKIAEDIWETADSHGERLFDYKRIYYGDIILASGANIDSVLTLGFECLSIGESNGWKETICRAQRILCSANRMLFQLDNKNSSYLISAKNFINKATLISHELHIPVMELEVLLEQIRLYIIEIHFSNNFNNEQKDEIIRLLTRIDNLILNSDFWLYKIESVAIKGWLELFQGNEKKAKEFCNNSIQLASKIRYNLILTSNFNIIKPLIYATNCIIEIKNNQLNFPSLEMFQYYKITRNEFIQRFDSIFNNH